MAQIESLNARGLYTHRSELSEVPPGSQRVCDNININREGLFELRRGLPLDSNTFGTVGSTMSKFFDFDSSLLGHYSSTMTRRNSDGSWTDYTGTFSVADPDFKLSSAQANNNLYISPDEGVKKLDSVDGIFMDAGAPRALDPKLELTTTVGVILPPNKAVSYKILWFYTDSNDNVIIGADGLPVIIANPSTASNTVNVTLTIPIPDEVDTTWTYQIYRSGQSVDAESIPPGDLQLVFENNPTAAQITAGIVVHTETTLDLVRGATLYTASTQEGASAANAQPPRARTLEVFKNHLFYGNTISRHNRLFSFNTIGGSGFVVSDTITLTDSTGTQVYTGAGAENASSRQFQVFTSGNAAENLENTARSLVFIINTNLTNTVYYAYYVSGFQSLPGRILIEKRILDNDAFTITSSRGAAFSPNLSGSGITSTNDEFQNGLAFSKPNEPEAVPLAQRLRVGSANKAILAIKALRDSLYIFKEDGIYRLSGDDVANFEIEELDLTAFLIAPETVVALANKIYCLTDQGIVTVSDTGVKVLSRRIENQINNLFTRQDILRQKNFAISYESDRKFIYYNIARISDPFPSQAFVYDVFTDTWTRWNIGASSGIVFDNALVLGSPSSNSTLRERKNLNSTDFVDSTFDIQITSVDGTAITVTGLTADNRVIVGDAITLANGGYTHVVAVNGNNLIVDDALVSTDVGDAIVSKAIVAELEWNSIDAGNPGIAKQWQEITYRFRRPFQFQIEVDFTTDIEQGESPTTIEGVELQGGWGQFRWGQVSWGGESRQHLAKRTYIPFDKQRANLILPSLKHVVAFDDFQLNGFIIAYRPVSIRTVR